MKASLKTRFYEGEDDFVCTTHAKQRLRERGIAAGSVDNNPHVRAVFDPTGTRLVTAYYHSHLHSRPSSMLIERSLPMEEKHLAFLDYNVECVRQRFPTVDVCSKVILNKTLVNFKGKSRAVNKAFDFLRNEVWIQDVSFDIRTGIGLDNGVVNPRFPKAANQKHQWMAWHNNSPASQSGSQKDTRVNDGRGTQSANVRENPPESHTPQNRNQTRKQRSAEMKIWHPDSPPDSRFHDDLARVIIVGHVQSLVEATATSKSKKRRGKSEMKKIGNVPKELVMSKSKKRHGSNG